MNQELLLCPVKAIAHIPISFEQGWSGQAVSGLPRLSLRTEWALHHLKTQHKEQAQKQTEGLRRAECRPSSALGASVPQDQQGTRPSYELSATGSAVTPERRKQRTLPVFAQAQRRICLQISRLWSACILFSSPKAISFVNHQAPQLSALDRPPSEPYSPDSLYDSHKHLLKEYFFSFK